MATISGSTLIFNGIFFLRRGNVMNALSGAASSRVSFAVLVSISNSLLERFLSLMSFLPFDLLVIYLLFVRFRRTRMNRATLGIRPMLYRQKLKWVFRFSCG